jgi:hypothetical protein
LQERRAAFLKHSLIRTTTCQANTEHADERDSIVIKHSDLIAATATEEFVARTGLVASDAVG